MPRPSTPTIEAYLKPLPLQQQQTLKAILDGIKAAFPELELRLAWNVPHFCLGKDYVVGISAARSHLSFSPWSKTVVAAHRSQLKGLSFTDNLIRLPVDWELNHPLLLSLVKARLEELKR